MTDENMAHNRRHSPTINWRRGGIGAVTLRNKQALYLENLLELVRKTLVGDHAEFLGQRSRGTSIVFNNELRRGIGIFIE
jgi:hypothetical protein